MVCVEIYFIFRDLCIGNTFPKREKILDTGVVCRMPAHGWEDSQITATEDIILKRRNGLYVTVIINISRCHRGSKGEDNKHSSQGRPGCGIKICFDALTPFFFAVSFFLHYSIYYLHTLFVIYMQKTPLASCFSAYNIVVLCAERVGLYEKI